mmetsp:Transcript_46579/g.76995  ORF Transcript_46579/g.76995 Transcript_46579/m.76995 type:complete len:202 (+) Transcript_46579:1-606(+)
MHMNLLLHLLYCILCGSGAVAFLTHSPPGNVRPPTCRRRALDTLVAGRKGRPNMPGSSMPQQQIREPETPPDGTPVFYLYCRTASKVMWYPVSSMRGDGQSQGLINAWLNSPFAKGVFKNRLDEGMARSIFESERRLNEMARKQYPMLKKVGKLEWGYKVLQRDIVAKEAAGELEKQKIVVVTKEMVKDSMIEQARKAVGL